MPKLLPDAVAAYLDRRSEWAVLTTLDADGYPHSAALGYFRIGGDICLGTPASSRKVRNLERDPRASLLVTSAKATGEWRGVLLQGTVTIVRDEGERLALEREGRRQRGVPEAELPTAPRRGEVVLRLTPVRTITWDFARP